MNAHIEVAPLITTLWGCEEYEAQWAEALRALCNGLVKSCVLITDVQPKTVSAGVTFWVLYKVDSHVFIQEHFSRDQKLVEIQSAVLAELSIPARFQGSLQEQSQVSEWKIPFEEVVAFVKKL